MNNGIRYDQWPAYVKIATALSKKKFLSSSSTLSIVLGYILLIAGIADAVYYFAFNKASDYESNTILSSIIIGSLCLWSGYASKWIESNSSWEERFQNNSSSLHKFIYIALTIIAIGSLVLKYLV